MLVFTGTYTINNILMYILYKLKKPQFEKYKVSEKPWPWEANPARWN